MGDSKGQPYGIGIGGKSVSVAWIQERANKSEFLLTGHAHKERQEEFIKTKEIRAALMSGEILENYPDDPRGSSCLVLEYSEWTDEEWQRFSLRSFMNTEDDKDADWEAFFNYNLDDVREKIAWAVTSASAISEWKNPEEEEIWK